MSEFRIVLSGPLDEPAATMGFAPTIEDAREDVAGIADHIDLCGSLPVLWDIAWAVPAIVVTRYEHGGLRIRCEAFERETGNGSTVGTGYIDIREVIA